MEIALYTALVSVLFLTGAYLFKKRSIQKKISHYRRISFPLQTAGALCLLFAFQGFTDFHLAKTDIPFIYQISTLLSEMLWWIIPGRVATIFIRDYFFKKTEAATGERIANIIRNFVISLLNTAIFCAILSFVFDMDITSLLATGGISAMIIGLAIQLNLSNLFSGISINIEHPMEVGNWVKVEGYPEGKVSAFTWRTIRLETRDGNIISIPNRVVSKSSIINYNQPDTNNELSLDIGISWSLPANRVEQILFNGVISTREISKYPPPEVRFAGFTPSAARYHVSFISDDYSQKGVVLKKVWANVKKHLDLAGITPAGTNRKAAIKKAPSHEPHKGVDKSIKRLGILNYIEILTPFSENQRRLIAESMHFTYLPEKSYIVRQDDPGDSLFIIKEGCAGVYVKKEGEYPGVRIDTLGAGSVFGEMALLTGETRSASIISETPVCIFEITKKDIYPLIASNKKILHALTAILTERKSRIHRRKENKKGKKDNTLFGSLFKMIHQFFK